MVEPLWKSLQLYEKLIVEQLDFCKRMRLYSHLTPYAKINSKWIKNFNVIPKTIKLLGEHRDKSS